jgi:hypothetical protein
MIKDTIRGDVLCTFELVDSSEGEICFKEVFETEPV